MRLKCRRMWTRSVVAQPLANSDRESEDPSYSPDQDEVNMSSCPSFSDSISNDDDESRGCVIAGQEIYGPLSSLTKRGEEKRPENVFLNHRTSATSKETRQSLQYMSCRRRSSRHTIRMRNRFGKPANFLHIKAQSGIHPPPRSCSFTASLCIRSAKMSRISRHVSSYSCAGITPSFL